MKSVGGFAVKKRSHPSFGIPDDLYAVLLVDFERLFELESIASGKNFPEDT